MSIETYIRDVGEHKMHLLKNDKGISLALARDGSREEGFMHLINDTVKPGQIAFELGGNIGYVTLLLAKLVGPTGKVIVAEPDPTNIEVLKKNIEMNGYKNVEIHQVAISNKSGEMTFYRSKASNLGGMTPAACRSEAITVRAESVDSLCPLDICPNFYKMDIEGHEVEALAGMLETLKRSPLPVQILMETHPFAYDENHSLEKIFRHLLDIGFHCKYILSAALVRPQLFKKMGYKPVKKYITWKLRRWNYGLYNNVSDEDMIKLACYEHRQFVPYRMKHTDTIVRAVMLEK